MHVNSRVGPGINAAAALLTWCQSQKSARKRCSVFGPCAETRLRSLSVCVQRYKVPTQYHCTPPSLFCSACAVAVVGDAHRHGAALPHFCLVPSILNTERFNVPPAFAPIERPPSPLFSLSPTRASNLQLRHATPRLDAQLQPTPAPAPKLQLQLLEVKREPQQGGPTPTRASSIGCRV